MCICGAYLCWLKLERMKIAVVGATGLVGGVVFEVLRERNFPVDELIPVASERSVGNRISFRGREYTVRSLWEAVKADCDLAIFSAGGDTSKEWAPRFADRGTIVIDNSSAWRMDPDKKLVVPEVNAGVLTSDDRIIANPNCSTIQMVVALAPLHRAFGIRRLVISTYQSFTGTGVRAVRQYAAERGGTPTDDAAYPHPIFANCLPHCDVFLDNAYTREEMKLVHETRKILGTPDLAITATAVRVPVDGGHSESINVEFERPFTLEEVREELARVPGLIVQDDPGRNVYPMPLMAKGRDEVFVGRLRRDESIANGLNLWVVADNLRKGAATNAVQIAEHLIHSGLIGKSPLLTGG
jgi:aspartate-semialdehyde dehydrogenase